MTIDEAKELKELLQVWEETEAMDEDEYEIFDIFYRMVAQKVGSGQCDLDNPDECVACQ